MNICILISLNDIKIPAKGDGDIFLSTLTNQLFYYSRLALCIKLYIEYMVGLCVSIYIESMFYLFWMTITLEILIRVWMFFSFHINFLCRSCMVLVRGSMLKCLQNGFTLSCLFLNNIV